MKKHISIVISLFLFYNPILFSAELAPPKPPNYGAKNAENSCFLNSAVQALFHTRPLRNFLDNEDHKKVFIENSTTDRFMQHLENLKTKKKEVKYSPREFRNKFPDNNASPEIKDMTGTNQHDAQEFLSYIIDRIRVEIVQSNKELKEKFSKIFGNTIEATSLWSKIENDPNPPQQYSTEELTQKLKVKIIDSMLFAERVNLYSHIKDKNQQQILSTIDHIIGLKKNKGEETDKYVFALKIREHLNNDELFINLLNCFQSIFNAKLEFKQRNDLINQLSELLENPEKDTPEILKEEIKQYNDPRKAALEFFNNKKAAIKPLVTTHRYTLETLYSKLRDLGINKDPIKMKEYNNLYSKFDSSKTEYSSLVNNLKNLTEELNNALKLQNQYKKIFAFTLKSTTKEAHNSSHNSIKLETNWMLQLNITNTEKKVPLTDVLKNFFEKEVLTNYNRWWCKQCDKLVESTKELNIQTLPEIITIQFKRFQKNGQKNVTRVTFPIKPLNMQPYLSPDSTETNTLYELYAIVIHSGGADPNRGHYYTYAKWNNHWFLYDDARTGSKSIKSMQEVAQQNKESGGPYLLFYQRIIQKKENLPLLKENIEKLSQKLSRLSQSISNVLEPEIEEKPGDPKKRSH